MARQFRAKHPDVPLILMGYFNPIYIYGVDRFLDDATASGVDGLIMVDLPPEEDSELCIKATDKGLAFIRLITPTTNDKRMPVVVENASGFVYYVSITGITGSGRASADSIAHAMAHIRGFTNLPAVVGLVSNILIMFVMLANMLMGWLLDQLLFPLLPIIWPMMAPLHLIRQIRYFR